MNARLRIMVDSREIEEAEAPDREVVARWHKAEGTSRDAGKDLGQESRLTLYYQAGLQAATALVRAAGFRVLGTDHHRHTFEAVHALEAGELSRIAREMNAFRRKRHQAIYDWDDTPGDASEESRASKSWRATWGACWSWDTPGWSRTVPASEPSWSRLPAPDECTQLKPRPRAAARPGGEASTAFPAFISAGVYVTVGTARVHGAAAVVVSAGPVAGIRIAGAARGSHTASIPAAGIVAPAATAAGVHRFPVAAQPAQRVVPKSALGRVVARVHGASPGTIARRGGERLHLQLFQPQLLHSSLR